jgi:SanA protein
MNFLKRFWRVGLILFLILFSFILISNIWVVLSTKSKVLSDFNLLPDRGIALVLGTSHRLTNGLPNPYFQNRISTAGTLYRNGKVSHFILSGDNRTRYYNEPSEMKKALIKQGVPDSAITLDIAGLRTLDSVVRSKEIFGQNNIVIITQPFHCYRALFISNHFNINAVAMAADGPEDESWLGIHFREYFARAKAVLDLYVLNTEPTHLGNKQTINL